LKGVDAASPAGGLTRNARHRLARLQHEFEMIVGRSDGAPQSVDHSRANSDLPDGRPSSQSVSLVERDTSVTDSDTASTVEPAEVAAAKFAQMSPEE